MDIYVNEYVAVHKIEKYLGRKLPEFTIEGMEPTRKRSKAPRKAKGGGWKQKGGRKPNGSGKPFGRPAGNPRGKARKPAAQGHRAWYGWTIFPLLGEATQQGKISVWAMAGLVAAGCQ